MSYRSLKQMVFFILISFGANACPPDRITVEKLEEMNQSYKDVKSHIACQKAKGSVEKIICSSPSLIVLSDLDAKAQVYGLENATQSQVSHKNVRDEDWEKNVLNKCKDESCVCDAYTAHIQQYLPDFNL